MSVTQLDAAPELAQDALPAWSPRQGFLTRLRRVRDNALASLETLADNPTAFFCGLLALNALALPYCAVLRDARLYAFQVQNVIENGRFADDLFFRYGSQDRYSLFSTVAAPLARTLGIPLSFFLLYLVGSALYLLAVQRLVRVLVPDRVVAALAVVAIAVTHIGYGGVDIFAVGEAFLTPRLFGIVLVLFGLERMLREHLLVALLLLGLSLALHPLMAVGGLLVFLGWCLPRYLTRTQTMALLATVSAATLFVLAYQPLGARLLGTMDAEWFEAVRRANPYQVPAMWLATDWLRIGVAIATFVAVLPLVADAGVRHFLLVLLAASALGVAGTVIACWLPYALPIQVQPYRMLWLAQLVQVPLGMLLLARWFRAESLVRRLAAGLLFGYFAVDMFHLLPLLPLAVALGVFVLWSARSGAEETRDAASAAIGLGVGLAVWAACHVIIVLTHWHQLDGLMEPMEYVRFWPSMLSPIARVVLLTAALLMLYHWLGTGWGFRVTTLAVCLVVQVGSFAIPFHEGYAARFRPNYADVDFVKAYLATHPASQPGPPTVYWPTGRIEHVWLDLRANCYVEWTQLSGNSFHRGTALEGQRRTELVKRFEIDNYRRHAMLLRPTLVRTILDIYQTSFDEPPPAWEDVVRLSQDPHVDFLVLREGFDGLFDATNGKWFIYDYRALRAALSSFKSESMP